MTTTRLKHVAKIIAGQSPEAQFVADLSDGLPFLQGNAEFGMRNPSARLECALAPKLARKGDALLSVRAPVGALNVADQDYGIGRGLNAIRPVKIDSRYLLWLLTHSSPYLDSVSTGSTFMAVTAGNVGSIQVPVTAIGHQRSIAAYLDAQTAKIDVLIEKQERLIETLAERRQAVISHAVTKGLDPARPTRDSGQAWLGDVPASWDVNKLRRTWRVIDCKHLTAEFVIDGIPLASIRELQSKWVDLTAAMRTTDDYYQQLIQGDRKPQARDLIFTRNATVGRVAQVSPDLERFAVGQDVCILRPICETTSSDYQQYLLQSWVVSSQIETLLLGSTFKRINVEQIRDFVLPVPGVEEQVVIVEYLDRETAQMDALSAKAREMIEILKERRQALISAAVTGKIDVRGLP